MEKGKILIVDDESRMRKLISDYLKKENYQILEACDGEEAMDCFYANKDISLILLDVMMPRMDGWEVCKEIRETGSKVPIVMLTARSEERDELKGFNLGVDEYIAKPFSPRILMARIHAIMRRNKAEEDGEILEAGGICMNEVAHEVTVDGNRLDLSVKEYELLNYFMKNRNVALSRDRILTQVWDYDYYGDARTIDTHVKKLRSKLGDKGEYIKTVWGTGYKFEV